MQSNPAGERCILTNSLQLADLWANISAISRITSWIMPMKSVSFWCPFRSPAPPARCFSHVACTYTNVMCSLRNRDKRITFEHLIGVQIRVSAVSPWCYGAGSSSDISVQVLTAYDRQHSKVMARVGCSRRRGRQVGGSRGGWWRSTCTINVIIVVPFITQPIHSVMVIWETEDLKELYGKPSW